MIDFIIGLLIGIIFMVIIIFCLSMSEKESDIVKENIMNKDREIINMWQDEYIKLEDRINKAIKYINENDLYTYIPDNDLGMDYNELVNEKLLDILKGVNKE